MTAAGSADTLLTSRALTVRFGGLSALNELDIDIRRGEVLGLIGPNGSGKTTLLNVISGVYAATSGTITLDGVDVTGESAQNLSAHGLARTFQRSRLCLPLSVFDNIALGAQRRLNSGLIHNLFRRTAFAAEARALATEARELLHAFNPALADKLFEPAISLGMIDRRRVEICRALIGRPKLVLLDEPSAGMTHEETDQVVDEILHVQKSLGGLTIVIVEHEMGLIERITDRCVVLNYGRKICEGPFREVAADPVVREAYLGQS
jgi:ABC-type branched-subunit amino acid transport system ATPase component